MTVRVTKPEFNLREKLTELDKPTGTKGLDLMRSETTQEARNSVSVGRKNLIINGDMRVAQRATSSTSNGYQTVDRFSCSQGSTNESPTQAQVDVASGTTPYTLGFRKAFKITNGNQTSGPQIGSEINVLQNIEAQDIVQSGWDYTSDSSYITWSFWIKSSVATNFYGYIRSYDNTAIGYAFETGNLSANVWTKIIKKIPGNPNININNDKGTGLQFRLLAYIGTAYSDNATPLHKWTTYSSTARVPEPPTTWYNTNDATLEMTGWQVEVGSNATEFEHRSLGEELALCQRYFFNVKGDNNHRSGIPGYANSTTELRACVQFPVPMRVTPTVGGTATAMVFDAHNDSASFNCNTLTAGGSLTNDSPHMMVIETTTSGMTNGQAGTLEFRAANGSINFDAEL